LAPEDFEHGQSFQQVNVTEPASEMDTAPGTTEPEFDERWLREVNENARAMPGLKPTRCDQAGMSALF
jgi:hypothetical protein